MNNIKSLTKRLIASFIYYSGYFNARISCLGKDNFLIIMYHRILPQNLTDKYTQRGMFVTPETFDKHLYFLKSNFELRPLSDILSEPDLSKAINSNKTVCYLTFDDGWVDFYYHAYPLLVKHQVSATVFLPTDFIGTKNIFWTERFSRLCLHAERNGLMSELKKSVNDILVSFDINNHTLNDDFQESAILSLKLLGSKDIEDALDSIENLLKIGSHSDTSDFLDWCQVTEMHKSGLVTFGSHTSSHRILTKLQCNEIYHEIHNSTQIILNKGLGIEGSVPFCFPNGSYNEEVIDIVRQYGLKCAVSTEIGINNNNTSKYCLKRIGIHQDISFNDALLAYRIYTALNI